MVSGPILVRDKWKKAKKATKLLVIIAVISIITIITYLAGFYSNSQNNQSLNQQRVVLENPLKNIVFEHTNEEGLTNKQDVVEQALVEFDTDYINYILAALGVGNLYKSKIGYGNPRVEFVLDEEIWSSEIINGGLNSQKSKMDNVDIRIYMSKEEIIESLLSSNIRNYMIDSVRSKRTNIEMVAGRPELLSKGYLNMYSELTGNEPEI